MKKVIKILINVLIVAVIAAIVGRIILNDVYPKKMTEYLWSEEAKEAYSKDESSFRVYTQEPHVFITSDGKFAIDSFYYTPELSEVQITVRYNNSTVEKLKSERPGEDISDAPFIFKLSDDKGNVYNPKVQSDMKMSVYNYSKLVFSDVDVSSLSTLFVDMTVNSDQSIYSSLIIYESELALEEVKYSKLVKSLD